MHACVHTPPPHTHTHRNLWQYMTVHCTDIFSQNTKIKLQEHSLAYWTPPGPSFAIELQVRFQIKALNVFTFITSCRKGNSLEGDRTFQ